MKSKLVYAIIYADFCVKTTTYPTLNLLPEEVDEVLRRVLSSTEGLTYSALDATLLVLAVGLSD